MMNRLIIQNKGFRATIYSFILFGSFLSPKTFAEEQVSAPVGIPPITQPQEEIEGVVRIVGPMATSEILIDPASGNKGPTVCRSDIATKLSKLTGYTVKVVGSWQMRKDKKQCLIPDSFQVTKASSGRDAIVGTLFEQGDSFTFSGIDGKTLTLADIPSGLKKLGGKKVILDLKPTENPIAKDEYKVVTYSVFPD